MTIEYQMTWEIQWGLPERDFQLHIRDLIELATENKKVIALPLRAMSGEYFVGVMSLLMAQVDCNGCNARCCRENVSGLPFHVNPLEFRYLVKRYGYKHFIVSGEEYSLPMPCPFLESKRCSIYEDRPLVCASYPFQPGATDGEGHTLIAVASECPEARRIAMRFYMAYWQLLRRLEIVYPQKFKVKKGG